MSSPPSAMWKKAASSLVGVTVDAVHEITVNHLDRVAGRVHHYLNGNAPSPGDAVDLEASAKLGFAGDPIAAPSSSRSAIITGALLGISLAVLLASRR